MMLNYDNAFNMAANLPAIDNKALQVVLGTRIAEYVIRNYRLTLPLHLFLKIDTDVDLCRTITYLCEDLSDTPSMSDSAVNAGLKRQTIAPPKVVTFSGFCKHGFECKLSVEQLECINQSDILMQWYQGQLDKAIEDGKDQIMARFYRHMISHAHPKNTGANAGLLKGGNQLGTLQRPVLLNPSNADKFFMSMLNVGKQMPRAKPVENEYGRSMDNMYFFGPQEVETVLMQTEEYTSYDRVGECATCALFSDVFERKPRGIMPITSQCVEEYVCDSSGTPITVYPILFGKRYMGTKAALRVKSTSYPTEDRESLIYRTQFYSHIHTFDCRFTGVAYVTIETDQPETVAGCS